ncbi:DUF983 domain-containing protein [Temperatibacter marinus]|uniref:DUF983 domain-containing protein n=1 Tax=Temperatibacter marinus TaxID=1456591 RepID=A0AA52EFU5_9PROT|nr:DUF983 domain-containing protein [Temperatibacter marinus]WND02908.1 DUF983 domain-containing protein [Temperatibacter marinus]
MQDQHTQNTETDREQSRSVSPVQAGLNCVCPNCGEGKLYASPLTLSLTEECAICGFDLKAADPADGPAVFAIFIMGFVVTLGALWLEFKIGVPFWIHLIVWPLVTIFGSIWSLRVLKGWIVAMQFQNDAREGALDSNQESE